MEQWGTTKKENDSVVNAKEVIKNSSENIFPNTIDSMLSEDKGLSIGTLTAKDIMHYLFPTNEILREDIELVTIANQYLTETRERMLGSARNKSIVNNEMRKGAWGAGKKHPNDE